MPIQEKFTAAVVGLGQMGLGYDFECSDGSRILTHASAYARHDMFELVGGVDPDISRRKLFESKYKRPAYPDVPSLISDSCPDIFSIVVPTQLHATVFSQVIQFRPMAVLCEKPIAVTVTHGAQMVETARKIGCALVVNYMRRFDSGVHKIKQLITDKEIGDIYKGIVWYSNGFLNNASHFIDLLIFLFGVPGTIEVIKKGRRIGEIDFEPDIRIFFGDAEIIFLYTHGENIQINSMELIGTGGKLGYWGGGKRIEIRKKNVSPIDSRYFILSPEKSTIETNLEKYQWHVLEHLKRHLIDGSPLYSNGNSALKTLSTIEKVLSML